MKHKTGKKVNYMIENDTMRKAWFKFKKEYKSSGRDGRPSVTSFCAGWAMGLEALKALIIPKPPKPKIGYIVVNYNLFKDDYHDLNIFVDGLNQECIVVANTFSNYLDSHDKCSDVGIYKTRNEARDEATSNNEEDPANQEAVWKVELDSYNNITKWLKKNP
jgi:hypothetical protein